jgi:pilus assembly protein Flp/PilA
MWFARTIFKDCAGASAAEYAIILAIIGTGIALAAVTLGQTISNAMAQTGTAVMTCGGNC